MVRSETSYLIKVGHNTVDKTPSFILACELADSLTDKHDNVEVKKRVVETTETTVAAYSRRF